MAAGPYSVAKSSPDCSISLLGNNFVAIVTSDVMSTMAETVRDLGMSHTQAQWLYIVSDTNTHTGNLTSLINALHEGENLAYMYNITDDHPDCKVSWIGISGVGIICKGAL